MGRYRIRATYWNGNEHIPCGLHEATAFDVIFDGQFIARGIKPCTYLANQIIDLHVFGKLTAEYCGRAMAA